jgi:hypothetical protein
MPDKRKGESLMTTPTLRASPSDVSSPMHQEPIAEIKVKGVLLAILPAGQEMGPRYRIALQHQDTDVDVEDSIYTPDEAAALLIGLEMVIPWLRKHR